jgi:hypothetical protein
MAMGRAPMKLVQLILTALIIGAAGGCTSWSRLNDGRPVPARGTIQVWSDGQDILLRDARSVGDSLVGQDPLPDTTRRTVALTTIDSVRIETIDAGKVLIVGSAVTIALLWASLQGIGGS